MLESRWSFRRGVAGPSALLPAPGTPNRRSRASPASSRSCIRSANAQPTAAINAKTDSAMIASINSPRSRRAEVFERLQIDGVTAGLHVVEEARTNTRGYEAAEDVSVGIETFAAERKELLHRDRIALHAGQLVDAG